MRLLLALILFLSSGCCAQYHKQDYYKNLKVQYDVDICTKQKETLFNNLKKITDYWENDFNRKVPSATVRIFDVERFKCGKVWAYGCFSSRINHIMVVTSRKNSLYSLYHELCHAAFARADVKHLNPNWPRWRHRARQIYRKLTR